jgi:hypothetical protein
MVSEEAAMKRCHKCGKEWVSEKRQPSFKDYCASCSAYLHCCINCRFRNPGKHNQCEIPTTEWVGDRAGANFCEDFEFADTEAQTGQVKTKEKARDAFDALFGAAEDK